ncbi:MAG: EAL domain-containing protein [Acidimicrobiales bacterium]|nr:EAL domain-containing protein [Acidimicrobiales bacterium]
MELNRGSWKIALWGAGAALAVYFALPTQSADDIAYVVIGVVSVAMVLAGLRLHRPESRLPWLLLVGYIALSVIGDGIENLGYGVILARPVPLPSAADPFYLAAYPLLFIGVTRLCQRTHDRRSRESHADAAIVVVAALALSWHFLMRSYFHDSSIGPLGKIVMLSYPLMDLGLVFIIVQSLVFGTARRAAHRILVVALLASLVSDFTYDVMVQYGHYAVGNVIDGGWLLNYMLIGVAALHPTMAAKPSGRDLTVPDSGRRIPLLALAGFVAPAILLVSSAVKATVDVPVIAGTSIVLFSLVSLRMSWQFERVRADALALEDALRRREELESDLRHQAFHDPLTGLANRMLLHRQVERVLAQPAGTRPLTAVCFCDLDGFKTVNDSLGHLYGDDLLAITAERLLSVVRAGDTVARLGGDEFAVLLESAGEPETVAAVADRIVAIMREPAELAGRQIAVSVSVGVALAGPHTTAEQLLSEADIAMYEAKRLGKSRWEMFLPAMQSQTFERLELTNAFRGSLERDEFFLLYQPLLRLLDGCLEGFEALVRWRHPDRGVIAPNQFIPVADETGFVVPLGRWVLETACEEAVRWQRESGRDLTVSVNLSSRQLQERHLCDDVRTALAVSGLSAGQLLLEVTETTLLADSEEIRASLSGLKDFGVRIALDDFGTGYSSIAYLRHLPLDVLKIDKSFVETLGGPGDEGEALVSTVLRFARILKLRTVAEGIESGDQLQALRNLGCDSAQGFFFAHPLTENEVDQLLVQPAATFRSL